MNLDKLIDQRLRKEFEAERAKHEPSGKLSAGQLGKPLLEQVLKVLGVPQKPVEDYVLRLFERGKQVEKWVLETLDIEDTQEEVEYKNCVGLIDGVSKKGNLLEVKSVKNSNLKWIKKDGAKLDHKLQLTLYMLAKKKETGYLLYVSAEDFQSHAFEVNLDLADEVDKQIKEVYDQIKSGVLPEFEPRLEWHKKATYPKYSNYPEWISLEPELAMQKLENQFPEAYKKLRGGE